MPIAHCHTRRFCVSFMNLLFSLLLFVIFSCWLYRGGRPVQRSWWNKLNKYHHKNITILIQEFYESVKFGLVFFPCYIYIYIYIWKCILLDQFHTRMLHTEWCQKIKCFVKKMTKLFSSLSCMGHKIWSTLVKVATKPLPDNIYHHKRIHFNYLSRQLIKFYLIISLSQLYEQRRHDNCQTGPPFTLVMASCLPSCNVIALNNTGILGPVSI